MHYFVFDDVKKKEFRPIKLDFGLFNKFLTKLENLIKIKEFKPNFAFSTTQHIFDPRPAIPDDFLAPQFRHFPLLK